MKITTIFAVAALLGLGSTIAETKYIACDPYGTNYPQPEGNAYYSNAEGARQALAKAQNVSADSGNFAGTWVEKVDGTKAQCSAQGKSAGVAGCKESDIYCLKK